MRILFIEDELEWDNVKRLFANTVFKMKSNVGKEMIESLDNAAKDEFGIDKRDIKKAIEENFSEHLVVCYDFKDAMQQILNYSDSFDLFIVDRNLKYLDGEGDIDGLRNLDSQFNQLLDDEMIGFFCQREGDWIFETLATRYPNINIRTQFYFLTANDDAIKTSEENRRFIRQGIFNPDEQLIIKGDDKAINGLISKIRNYPYDKLKEQYADVFSIIDSKAKNKDARERYIKILKNRKNHEYLNQMRQFIDNNIIKTLANDKKVPEEGCRFYDERNGKLRGISMRPFVRWLNKNDNFIHLTYLDENEEEKKIKIADIEAINEGHADIEAINDAHDEFKRKWDSRDEEFRLGANKIVLQELWTMVNIINPGSHESQDPNITQDTVMHCFLALNDIIRWWGTIDD